MALFDIFNRNKTNEYLSGFSKTNSSLGKRLLLLDNDLQIDDLIEEIMISLIESDMGYQTAQKVCDSFYKKAKNISLNKEKIYFLLKDTLKEIYVAAADDQLHENNKGPTVIMLVGINGSGKTTTCAKLAGEFQNYGYKILMAAADTFRAGAIKQLQAWGERLYVDVVAGKENQDPSSVIVDACRKARDEKYDVLICDTAGRLQNKKNLMAELSKMKRVCAKEIEGAPHNTLLVLDANTGQNGLSQAEIFKEATELDGIILTKVDGTAKGGIVLAIKDQLQLPVRFLGLGEKESDLCAFDIDLYLDGILRGLYE